MPEKLKHIKTGVEEPAVTEHLSSAYNFNAKPFLKWAGGKGQLLQKFEQLYPQELKDKKIKNYYEPFLGSGAVFFDVVQKFKVQHAYLYDINPELVLTYNVVKNDVAALTDFLFRFEKTYHKLNGKKRDEYYYGQRQHYNLQRFNTEYNKYAESWIARAAQFIFLNRTCFNGLYRVNLKGEFNTPVGSYIKPLICDEYNLLAASKLLEIATIKQADFRQVKKDFKTGSFVYFDPPYRPLSKTASFTAYSAHSFTDKEQEELKKLFTLIHQKGGLVLLSNSDPKNSNPEDNFFDDLYKDFNIYRLPAKRMINANAAKRGSITEIAVTNY
jgi:DNA adenine methylase